MQAYNFYKPRIATLSRLSDWIIPNRLIVLLEASDGVGSEREGEVVAGPVDVTGGEGGQLSPDPLTPTLPRFPSLLFCS